MSGEWRKADPFAKGDSVWHKIAGRYGFIVELGDVFAVVRFTGDRPGDAICELVNLERVPDPEVWIAQKFAEVVRDRWASDLRACGFDREQALDFAERGK